MSACAVSDLLGASDIVQDTYAGTGSPVPDHVAIRNYKTSLFIKNVSTYQLRLRVTTWVCRHNIPLSPWNTLSAIITGGFLPPYVKVDPGNTALSATQVSTSLFMNPLMLYFFKALKVKHYTLMPYRTRMERLHLLKRKPGLIRPASVSQSQYLAVQNSYGITTCFKTVEVVGELANDDEAYPDTSVFNSAGVLLLQYKTEFECAGGQAAASIYGIGDAAQSSGSGVSLTGQPWNYMFPTPGTSSSFGTSSVIGALSSGV